MIGWMRTIVISLCVLTTAAFSLLTTSGAGAAELSSAAIGRGLQAFQAGESGDWDRAHRLISSVDEPLAAKLIRWRHYIAPDSGAGFDEIATFIEQNPQWPRHRLLRQRAEEALAPTLPARRAVSWYDRFEPITTQGKASFARALLALGEHERATEIAREAWVAGSFSTASERAFLAEFGGLITAADHVARLDWLVWRGRTEEAQRMLARVDAGRAALARARMDLRAMNSGVDDAIARVPAHLLSDPGLVYERVRWRRIKGLDSAARALLLSNPGDAIEPERWWAERQILARRAMADGQAKDAYRVASGHRVASGADFAEAEWLSGWIALRYLHDAKAAARHFEALYAGVNYPISLARGAYWAGRAAEAAGKERDARRWYGKAAAHPATFYGQLAAGRLEPDRSLALPADPKPTAEERKAFDSYELVAAARMLTAFGQRELVGSFLIALGSVRDAPGWQALTASLAHQIGRPDLAVVVARQATRGGELLVGPGYPAVNVPTIVGVPHEVEQPLVLAMVRQESAYRADAVSSAGARGLMQLMPGTAQEVAAKLNVPYSKQRLVTDQAYNLTLGQRYISSMLARFDGSYVLALAAYNAGPSRVRQWQQENGDPRQDVDRAVDWIERIPFSETRNYVQRILEHLQVYRGKANGGDVSPSMLVQDLQG